jgi:hypothetical protein
MIKAEAGLLSQTGNRTSQLLLFCSDELTQMTGLRNQQDACSPNLHIDVSRSSVLDFETSFLLFVFPWMSISLCEYPKIFQSVWKVLERFLRDRLG